MLRVTFRGDLHQNGAQIRRIPRALDQTEFLQPADGHRRGGGADPFVGGQFGHPDRSLIEEGHQDGQLRQGSVRQRSHD